MSIGTQFEELLALVRAYFRQEALEPAKSAGRLLAFAAIAGFLFGGGLLLCAVALLRYLATLDVFAGELMSSIPYFAAAAFCLVSVGALAMAARRG